MNISFPRLFVLADDGKTPVPVDSIIEWGQFLEHDARRQLALDVVSKQPLVEVSTIFIGIDYNFGRRPDEPPRCWETMVFGGENDRWCQRYSSHDDAMSGHKKAVRYTKRGLPIP